MLKFIFLPKSFWISLNASIEIQTKMLLWALLECSNDLHDVLDDESLISHMIVLGKAYDGDVDNEFVDAVDDNDDVLHNFKLWSVFQ